MIDKKEIIEDLGGLMLKFVGCEGILEPIRKAIVFLISLPDIVRCKDCKHWGEYDCHITSLTGQKSQKDWFCADGERRTDDD